MARRNPRTSGRKSPAASREATAGRGQPARGTTKPKSKSRSLAARLAAEVDALKAELARSRMRIVELETRVDEDPLTGLLNRRGFFRALERALAFARRYGTAAALLYLDLDRFKPINDQHGHAAGDWVLGRLARLVAGNVRASDVVARVGGDEFVILLWNVSEARAREKARVLETLVEGNAFEMEGRKIGVGLSCGVTMFTAEDTAESALARADRAMYVRKRERRNGRGR